MREVGVMSGEGGGRGMDMRWVSFSLGCRFWRMLIDTSNIYPYERNFFGGRVTSGLKEGTMEKRDGEERDEGEREERDDKRWVLG